MGSRAEEGETGWRGIMRGLDLCISPRSVRRWEGTGVKALARAEFGMSFICG